MNSLIQAHDDAHPLLAVEDDGTSLHDTLVAQLRKLLIEGGLPSGKRVPEAELCRRFGVSRTPLREALKVMAAEGYVQLRPNRGAIVAPFDAREIEPIFEVKGALERLIGLKLPSEATDDDIAYIESLHEALGRAVEQADVQAYTRLNYTFHRALSQATHNPVLIPAYDALQQKIWRFRFMVNEDVSRIARSYTEHQDIMVALLARTPLDLAARLEEHNRKTCEAMMRAV